MKKVVLFLAVALMGFAAKAQVAFSEDFDNVTTPSGIGDIPSTWTLYGDTLNNYARQPYNLMGNSWKVVNFSDLPSKMAFSCSYTQEGTMCDRWMVTPAITIPGAGYSLTFDLVGPSSQDPESFKIMISNDVQKDSFAETIYNEFAVASGINTHLVNLDSYAGQTVYLAFINYGTNAYYVGVDNIKVSVVPGCSIEYAEGFAPSFSPIGSSFDMYTAVLNTGCATLTSYTLTYTLNDGEPQTRTITGLNVAPYDYYIDTITITPTSTCLLNIGLEVSAPNGETDPDLTDNSGSLSTIVYNPENLVTRTTLLENFTTGACQYCPAGHDRLHEALVGMEDDVVWVAHHTGYGSDDMTLTESEQLAGYYTGQTADSWVPGLFGPNGEGGNWAPAMALDRNAELAVGANDGGAIGSVSSDVATISSQFAAALAVPSFASIGLSNIAYNETSRQLTFTVSGDINAFYGTEPRLSVFLLEDSIIARQADARRGAYIQNYVHNNVVRKFMSGVWGDADAFTANTGSYSKSYTYTLPATMNAAHCRVVAFVSDYGPDFLHRTVMNATQSG